MERKDINTDILLICKGWYNKEKHKDVLSALNAYYHNYYGCEKSEMDKAFALSLFLKPLALDIIKKNPDMAVYLFATPTGEFEADKLFTDVMYTRCLSLIRMVEAGTYDLSSYKEMIKKARDCNFSDTSIGII